MRNASATFVTSAAAPSGFPAQTLPEIAFAGRSNVGKSSLLNALVGVPRLARTSNTPGRTRLLNWFRVEHGKLPPVHFVDLPGYGYAQVSRAMRESWRPLIERYLSRRKVLAALLLLIDARRGGADEEADLLAWLAGLGVPAIVVLTKIDKLAKSKRKPAAYATRRALALSRDPVLFSAHTGDGIDELWHAIAARLKESQRTQSA